MCIPWRAFRSCGTRGLTQFQRDRSVGNSTQRFRTYGEVTLEKLGSRALSTLSVWCMALLWTLSYADGAGFGGATYRNECPQDRTQFQVPPDVLCPLVHHALFPPHVSLLAFAGNVFAFWFDGMYDSGLMLGVILAVVLLACASQMRRYVAEFVFSWPVIFIGCPLFFALGYLYEIHRTLSTGASMVPLF